MFEYEKDRLVNINNKNTDIPIIFIEALKYYNINTEFNSVVRQQYQSKYKIYRYSQCVRTS